MRRKQGIALGILGYVTMVFSYCAHGEANIQKPHWAVDPLHAGPDLPPSGRSLFDFLVARQGEQGTYFHLPFPFPDLLATIETRLAPHAYFSSPLQRVLVPLGRSLQRNAASPQFFEYPRALIAADAEPARNPDDAGMFIKHRLYLGYHEKAGVIEIISYNEAAGRFEFQLVQDYREGATPRLVYANRTLCMTCHQNAAPIFAKPLWDESNANGKISARLESIRERFYGFPARQSIDIAYAFDNATDQANRYSAYQRIWRDACGLDDSDGATRCRAALLTAVLQYRLSSSRHFDTESPQYANLLVPRLAAHWRQAWPGGLAIPDADIPNRKPLPDSGVSRAPSEPSEAELLYASDVPAALEPLQFREPSATWLISQTSQGDMQQIVAGLSQFLSEGDIERLDRFLSRATYAENQLHANCELTLDSPWPHFSKMRFVCGGQAVGPRGLALEGSIYEKPRNGAWGKLTRLSTGTDTFNDLLMDSWRIEHSANKSLLKLQVTVPHTGLHARQASGNAINGIGLALAAGTLDAGGTIQAGATVRVAEDFALLKQAVERLSNSDALSSRPFRRAVLIKSLNEELGMPPLQWCCTDAQRLPPPRLERETQLYTEGQLSAEAQLFHRYCGICHRSPNPFPPNFLWGDAERVERQLAQCAERIAFRLSMWQSSPHERLKTPMPPRLALPALNLSEREWTDHDDLAALKDHALGLLPARTVQADLLGRDYATLQSCLATPRH